MKTIKALVITIIIGFLLIFASCSDNNEVALKKTGIELSQKDSIIAMQSYRCNYTLSYVIDTIDYCAVNGQKTDSIDITMAVNFNSAGNLSSYSYIDQIYTSPNILLKKYTTWQCDSLISKIYVENTKTIGLITKTGYRISKSTHYPVLVNKEVIRTIKVVSHKLEKNYNNLYNIKLSK